MINFKKIRIATPRLAELENRRLSDFRVGEKFFDYEYLREFKAKIARLKM